MAERIPQSIAIRVPLKAYLSSDGKTPATGKTIAVTISKNGSAYGNPSAGATNATAISNGSYYVDLSTTDTNTLGPLFVLGTEGTIDQIDALYHVVLDLGVKTTIRGTVSGTGATTTQFTCATLDVAGITVNQFVPRLIVFDYNTTTAGLRGTTTDIRSSSIATLPLFTYAVLPAVPQAGDSFTIE